jgi:hypothetical protein
MSVATARFLRGEGRSRYLPSGASASHDVACVPASRRHVRGSFARRAGRALALSIQVLRSDFNGSRSRSPEIAGCVSDFLFWGVAFGSCAFPRAGKIS